MSSYIEASNAYKKISSAAQSNLKSQDKIHQSEMNILKAGDSIEIVHKPEKSFSNLINDLVSPQINKIREFDKELKKKNTSNENSVKLLTTLNTTSMSIEAISVIKDKFIEAYKALINTPL